jgi:hypothetical protein
LYIIDDKSAPDWWRARCRGKEGLQHEFSIWHSQCYTIYLLNSPYFKKYCDSEVAWKGVDFCWTEAQPQSHSATFNTPPPKMKSFKLGVLKMAYLKKYTAYR